MRGARRHRSNPHSTSTTFTKERNNQPNRSQTIQSHPSTLLLSANTQALRSKFQINGGLQPCGARVVADVVDAALISAPHYKEPSNSSLPAFTKFLNSSRPSTPSRPHCEKVLMEGKKTQDKLHTGHFGRVVQVYCSCNKQLCFKIDQKTQYSSEIHIFTSVIQGVCLECAANSKHVSCLQHLVLFLTTHSETIKFFIAPIRIKRCLWSNKTWNL